MKLKINPKITSSFRRAGFKLKKSSPTILTVVAAVGVIATGYFSAKAAPKALELIEKGRKNEDMTDNSKAELIAVNIKYGWKPFVPAVIIGASTITCIFGANILNKHQQAAITSAYMMLESQFKEYRNKVIELHGEEEDKKIIESIVQSSIEPLSEYDEVLTFSMPYLDSYFESSTARVAFAMQQMNYYMMADGCVCLNQLFDFLGLEDHYQDDGDYIGWSGDDIMINWGLPPVLEYRFHDRDDLEEGMVIREIEFWCDPTFEAIDRVENPDKYW